jgi:tetratricopeptide (TPR) repeat protein
VAVALTGLSLAGPASAQIPVELRFDGEPFESTAPPEFTCFDEAGGRWVGCPVARAEARGGWRLQRPAPGRYRLHVSIDENPINPRRYPGDYEGHVSFEATDTEPRRLLVDLARLIHLTRPADNGRALEGMLTGCATQPRFPTRRHAWTPSAVLEVAWAPIVADAEYRYSIATFECDPPVFRREIASGRTAGTSLSLTLPPSAPGEHYALRLEAWRDNRLIGDFYTHDAGTHSWNYRFRVLDATVPRWAYLGAGVGLILLLLGAEQLFGGVDAAGRRRRLRVLAGGILAVLVLGALVIGGQRYLQHREQRRAETEAAAAERERAKQRREAEAAFAAAAPRPDWWDSVSTPYRADTLGDLLSAWQGHPRTPQGERQFFKAAYQGILDHPDDDDLVASAIELLYWVVPDYPHRLALAKLGFERYLRHDRRTDNCANCMVGDTAQGLALNLSRLYTEAGRPDEALAVCRRLLDERGADVSPDKLAEIWNQVAWAHWHAGQRERAREVIREAIARYGQTARGDDLRSSLATFER